MTNDSKLKQYGLAALFGLLFGFLLQKGGVAKYNVLMGVLLLEDFTVLKVMVTAVLVGMIGVYTLYALGKVKLHLQPTRLAANIVGGLLFGIGFALIAYCPGTGMAALGQGNKDAIFGMVGLCLGSYLFAEVSGKLQDTFLSKGDCGTLTLSDLTGIPLKILVPVCAVILFMFLCLLEHFTIR